MSAEVLDGAVGLYREAVARGDLVGAVLLVARQGRVVLHEAVGLRDQASGLPMERGTLFRMASNTKPVVATGIASLVERRALGYGNLVREYMPEWDNYRAGFITVGQLLSHTSGLRIPTLFLEPLLDGSTLPREAARFGEVGARVPPGTSYSYNNPGFNTLGALIELSSGQLLEEYLTATVYGPLGMSDSYNHRAGHQVDGKLDRMGAVYYRRGADGAWEPGGTPGGPTAFPFARGSGGMISTTWDYALFCQMFLNGGVYDGARILAQETVELMTSAKPATDGGYGYGWSVSEDGFGHTGSDGTGAWIDPERETIVLVFTQTPRGQNPSARFREMVRLAIEN
jgi:CubicO group peptidase (beta-lactamase class C family)